MTDLSEPELAAPPLPVEGHIATAVRALEAANGGVQVALILLQHFPRDSATMVDVLATLHRNVSDAASA